MKSGNRFLELIEDMTRDARCRAVPQYHIELSGYRVNFHSSEGDLDALRTFYRPYYELRSGIVPDAHLLVVALVSAGTSELRPSVTDMRVYLQPSEAVFHNRRYSLYIRPTTNIQVLVDRSERRIIVRAGNPVESNLQMRTLVRDQILRQIEKPDGSVVFHGSAVQKEGMGIAFMGPRNAGKTTSLLSFMAYQHYDFLSADRVKLRSEAGGIAMVGMPARCNITRVALERDPFLKPIRERLHVAYDFEGKSLIEIGPIIELAGVRHVAGAWLRVIVFPELREDHVGLDVDVLNDPEEVKQQLEANVMEGTTLDKHVHWLHYFPDKRGDLQTRTQTVTAAVARTVRFLRVRASHGRYAAAVHSGAFDPWSFVS